MNDDACKYQIIFFLITLVVKGLIKIVNLNSVKELQTIPSKSVWEGWNSLFS